MAKSDIICSDCGQPYRYAWEHAKVCPGAKPSGKLRDIERSCQRAIKAVHVAETRNRPASSQQAPTRREKPSTERVKKWRKAHPEEARKAHRSYMKKWRAKS